MDSDTLSPMSGGETSRNAMANRNHATMFFTVAPRPDIDDAAAVAAYERASAHLASLPEVPAEAPGYRLFWVRGDDVGHRDIDDAGHAIVGRHSACDVALSFAAELSLRHLLVATTRVADGARALRVLDLRASLPFYTDDGLPRRSIVATGPVVLRLGTYLFGGVPIGPDIPRALLPALMPRAIVTCAPGAPDGVSGQTTPSEQSTMAADEDDFFDPPLPAPASPPRIGGVAHAQSASPHLSRVTVVPPTALLTEMVRPDAGAAFARLTLLREGHSASIDLPAADLDAGVLIGRSERCADGGLRRVLDGNISRIHVLLLREGDDVLVFDLCSTQGTFHDGAAVRRHRLERGGGCVSLARTNPVMLCLHPRGEQAAAVTAPPVP